MIRLMRRSWTYLVALLGRRLEDAADPEIQIEQAIEEGKRQHALLVQQAAAVIGSQRELEMRLGRSIERVEELRSSAREALRLADGARRAGDDHAANSYEETARTFATSLVSTEAEMRDLKALHDHAVGSATGAKDAVVTNAVDLRRRLIQQTRLLSQLEQTKLQERMNAALGTVSSLGPDADVPSLKGVRDKIEHRYALALGIAELGSTTVEAGQLQVQKATLDAEATRQLTALRRSLAAEGEAT